MGFAKSLFSARGSRVTSHRVLAEITWFQCEHRNCLVFCAGQKLIVSNTEIDLFVFWVGGWSWHGFCMRVNNHLVILCIELETVLVCDVEIDLTSSWGSNLTWSECMDWNWHIFCVGVENDLGLASGSKLTWSLCRCIIIRSNLQWASNWLDFSDASKLKLILVWVIELR